MFEGPDHDEALGLCQPADSVPHSIPGEPGLCVQSSHLSPVDIGDRDPSTDGHESRPWKLCLTPGCLAARSQGLQDVFKIPKL